jgi:endonuclease/exonuclease/phosphatase family metal-dependent hydrolase
MPSMSWARTRFAEANRLGMIVDVSHSADATVEDESCAIGVVHGLLLRLGVNVLRVMTYNIRHGLGADGRIDLGRISEVIASYAPDVLGIQEVDVNKRRSGLVDQPGELARRLGMTETFQPCVVSDGEHYGIATLSRIPIRETRHLTLPARSTLWRSEPRCALVTRFAWPDESKTLDVVNTHLSTVFRERTAQTEALACELGGPTVVVIGDFNCTPLSPAYKRLCHLRSATWFARTWPASLPLLPLDHILIRGLEVVRAGTWTAKPARVASDHLPVFAELAA